MMHTKEADRSGEIFSENLVQEQIQRIFLSPAFSVSDILRRFLAYITNETLAGRSNTIKEYTIAINVLNKPTGFKPQHDAIVRIHAGRLRRALNYYYKEQGIDDEIEIKVPKGSYVPVFERLNSLRESGLVLSDQESFSIRNLPGTVTLVVIPFVCLETNNSRLAFTDSLGRQLCGELGKLPEFSVISYYAVSELLSDDNGIRSLASNFGVQYAITGNVQFESRKLRADVQLTDIKTGVQIWTELYQCVYHPPISFELADDIVARVMDVLGDFNELFLQQNKKRLMISHLNRNTKAETRIRQLG